MKEMKEIDFLALITDKVNKANDGCNYAFVYIKETLKTGSEVVTMRLEFHRMKDGVFNCVGIQYRYRPQLGEVYQRLGHHIKDIVKEEEGYYLDILTTDSKIGSEYI